MDARALDCGSRGCGFKSRQPPLQPQEAIDGGKSRGADRQASRGSLPSLFPAGPIRWSERRAGRPSLHTRSMIRRPRFLRGIRMRGDWGVAPTTTPSTWHSFPQAQQGMAASSRGGPDGRNYAAVGAIVNQGPLAPCRNPIHRGARRLLALLAPPCRKGPHHPPRGTRPS